jgi:large subunit ribosomal protein L9
MSAGPNGKLYGAVTNHTIAEEIAKHGFDIERRRIDIPGLTIKHTGKYTVVIHLYETVSADLTVVVSAQVETHKENKPAPRRRDRYAPREDEVTENAAATENAAIAVPVAHAEAAPQSEEAPEQ